MTAANEAPWSIAFDITGAEGNQISLRQVSAKGFALGHGIVADGHEHAPDDGRPEVTIRYKDNKPTGLENYPKRGGEQIPAETLKLIRTVDSIRLPTTDLASVPGPMRWFTNTYGSYTPAALIHDWLIPSKGEEPPIKEEYADRYFRYMLCAVGVPRFKRYIMWTAVALRTRWESPKKRRRPLLVLWALASLAGLAAFTLAILSLIFNTWTPFGIDAGVLLLLSIIAPFVFSLLWGRQYTAGIVAALAAPWLVPAALIAAFGYGVYWVFEQIGYVLLSSVFPDPPDLDVK